MRAKELLDALNKGAFTDEHLGPLLVRMTNENVRDIALHRNAIVDVAARRMREVTDEKTARALTCIIFQCGVESVRDLVQ